jgi:hypothetical protein
VKAQEGMTERAAASTNPVTGRRRCAMRLIRDEFDNIVLVYEVEPSTSAPEPRKLVFESRDFCEELLQFPIGWRNLGREALLALREQE